MSKVNSKFLDRTTGTNGVNGRSLNANFTSSNYTAAQVASEGNTQISAHLNGINTALATKFTNNTGDIAQTSFSASNNQSSAANVTGLAFANGSVRSFRALVSVTLIATASKYQVIDMIGIQRGSDWLLSYMYAGDDTGLVFSITTAGQVQYTSTSAAGFSSSTIKFSAVVTNV